MAHDVFISHSSRDKPFADGLCAALEAAQIRCWIAPRDLIPGRPFSGEIIRGIKSCRVMVLVFSSSSNTSPDVLREVQLATRHRLHLINFRIEQAPVSDDLDYFLGIPHWLDALTQPMAEHHAKLVESVKALLALEPAPMPATSDAEDEAFLAGKGLRAHGGAAESRAHGAAVPPPVHVRAPAAPALAEPPKSRGLVWLAVAALLAGGLAVAMFGPWGSKAAQNEATPTPAPQPSVKPMTESEPKTTAGPVSAPVATPAPVSPTPVVSTPPASTRDPVANANPPEPAKTNSAKTSPPPVAAPPLARADWPAELREASAAKPWTNSLGMKFVWVPITPTTAGAAAGPAWFSIYETRIQDYLTYMKEVPDADKDWTIATYSTEVQGPMHPVVNISWEDARAFCAWLTKREHAAGRLPASLVYRLPTDHEWSCAAGLPEGTEQKMEDDIFPWGTQWPPPAKAGNYADATAKAKLKMFDDATVVEGRYDDGVAFTAPVGSYTPNALGIYDLGGNAWEWCGGWSDENKFYHDMRGGSWMVCTKKDMRSGYRSIGTSTSRNIDQGFRVVVGEAER